MHYTWNNGVYVFDHPFGQEGTNFLGQNDNLAGVW